MQEPEPIQAEESLGNQFLSNIPEQDRPIVQKYIKGWDGQVTKKFQEYSGKLKPWEELGSYDEVANSVQWIRNIQEDPVGFLNNFQELIRQAQEEGTLPMPEITDPALETADPVVAQGEQDEIALLKQQYADLEARWNKEQESRTEAQQLAEFDKQLQTAHTTHGDFDEEYVLAKMAAGFPMESAIEMYNQLVEKAVSSQQNKKTPPVSVSGGGYSPGQVDPAKMTAADRIAFMAQSLAQANS